MKGINKVLVLGPHTDDGEFGCGGTIARFIEEGKDLYYATFSCAEESVPEGLPKDILLTEVKKASAELGIKRENLLIYRYPVRKFAHHRQDILEDLVKLNKEIKPELVLMPSNNDLHQDHYTIAREGLRAFKFTSILGYEMPWNNITFETRSFIYLEERHVEKKLDSLKCYRSQIGKKYANAEYIKGLARTRGVQIGVEFAETFDVLRWIIK
ncbi:MAG: PIG-L family deacetylase [Candidatus Cloacimonetes bacterium]|nr:PIG-L family deacetylase [Candidatus Cloacimonadota bacterium]MBS3768290.1 PIG-L family deacetylase [Candidatus Cloacimonadota bacterium]